MENIRNPPFCFACDGAGFLYSNLENISLNISYPKESECKACSGTGIYLKSYDINQYNGELILFEGRLALLIKQNHRNNVLILVGSKLRTVSTDNIEFVNLRTILPKEKVDLSFL